MPEEKGHEMKSVTPKEAGFVRRQVRCENCEYYEEEDSHCHLFMMLNDKMKIAFKLNEKVDKYGCCNAQMPKQEKNRKEYLESITEKK